MKPITILLVEDNPGEVLLLRTALNKAQIANQLLAAANSDEALDVLYRRNGHENDAPIDIALFDISIPGMNGIELLHHVKSDPALKQLPVIMLSGSDASVDIRASYEQHANCYITKPASLDGLMEVVRSLESFWFSIASLPSRG